MNLALFDTQDRLLTLLRNAVPAPVSVDISPLYMEPEHVWIAGETPGQIQRQYVTSGVTATEETFDLTVYVLTEVADADFRIVRDRCKTLADTVTTAIAADPTLGGHLQLMTVTAAQPAETIKDDITRQMMIALTVRCTAWVTT